jgi:hypothetical protein
MGPKLPDEFPKDRQANADYRWRVLADIKLDKLSRDELRQRRRDHLIFQVNSLCSTSNPRPTSPRPELRRLRPRHDHGPQRKDERPIRPGVPGPQDQKHAHDQVVSRAGGASHVMGSVPVPQPHRRMA